MDSYEMSDKRKAIIKTTCDYMLKTGLSNASVGELCKETKLAQSSLYYWFETIFGLLPESTDYLKLLMRSLLSRSTIQMMFGSILILF